MVVGGDTSSSLVLIASFATIVLGVNLSLCGLPVLAISVGPPTLGLPSRGPKVARSHPMSAHWGVPSLGQCHSGAHPARSYVGGAWPELPTGLSRSHPGVFKAHRLARLTRRSVRHTASPGLFYGATRWTDRPVPRCGSFVCPPAGSFLPLSGSLALLRGLSTDATTLPV